MHELACSETLLSQCSFEYAHSENCTIFTVSVRKVSVRAPEGSNMLKHAGRESLLSQRSFANSETLLSQRSCEYACGEASSALAAKSGEYSKLRPHSKLRCDHCRSFDPFEWVEASIHSQFFFFSPKQVDGPS